MVTTSEQKQQQLQADQLQVVDIQSEKEEPSTLSCYKKFIFALNAPETKRQWPRRFQIFLDYLKLEGTTIEAKAIKLYSIISIKDSKWLEDKLIEFFTFQNERVDKGELSPNTIMNYFKPIKLFCEMNGILVNWKLITKGIKTGNGIGEDRPPSKDEIKKLVESASDIRIKVIVSIMISSGIRVGSWDYLKWKHITPIVKDNVIVAGKIDCYNTKTKKWYYSFITPEAYNYLKNYMDLRQSHGETITEESWLVRNTWKTKSQRFGNYLGLASEPIQLKSSGIRILLNKSWKIYGIRKEHSHYNSNKSKRFDFKNVHGFRKFFETECQKVMNPVNISYLMSHNTGMVQHYYKPTEGVLLQDYLKAIDLLTINEEYKLSKKVQELKQKNDYQNYIIDKKIKEKDDQIEKQNQRIEMLIDEVAKSRSTIEGLDSNYYKVFAEIDKEKAEKQKLLEKLQRLESNEKEHNENQIIMNNIMAKFEKWEREEQERQNKQSIK